MKNKVFNVRMLRSMDYPEVAKNFAHGQANALKFFGVEGVTSTHEEWRSDPNSFMFVAEDANKEQLVAGMRLDIESDSKHIPMSYALKKLSSDFKNIVDSLKTIGLAEGCGWWIKNEYSGLGLPSILLRAGISVSIRLGINYILGFPHQHTKAIMSKYGFTTVDIIGDNGTFVYPDERYCSTVVELNTQTLHTTPKNEREEILFLRDNPNLQTKENGLSLIFSLL